jgi:Uma2 family endonuclease
MSKTITVIRPADHGRKMSLAEFEHAEAEEGNLYELSRGVITVVDVLRPRHEVLIMAIRRQLHAYDLAHPERIHLIASGAGCKLLIQELESERHPDLAIYKTPPPEGETDDDVWSLWIPEIVIEVVSASSRHRDYHEKPEEYLRLGVVEYWIVDPDEQVMKILRRSRGIWSERVVRPSDSYRTRLLPGLNFSIGAVFQAACGS